MVLESVETTCGSFVLSTTMRESVKVEDAEK